FNLDLVLKKDGRFQCQWFGCAGLYGSTVGTWSVNCDRITIDVTKSNGIFTAHPLGNMSIINDEGTTRLLLDKDADFASNDPRKLMSFSFSRTETESDSLP